MSNKTTQHPNNDIGAYVKFDQIIESGGFDLKNPNDLALAKELKIVETTLNLKPIDKKWNSREKKSYYVPSQTNQAVMSHLGLTARLISGMLDQGLSYANKDYYIYCQFGGVPSVTKSPNGMARALTNAASKVGVKLVVNGGCVFEKHKLKVVRNGIIDTIELENDPEYEIRQHGGNDLVAPYTVITELNDALQVISSTVTIVRDNEYKNAKAQSKGNTHEKYPVPMAIKIAMRRAILQSAASLGVADDPDLMQEIDDHDADYDMDKAPDPSVSAPAAQPEEEKLPVMSDEEFDEAYPHWVKAVADGQRTIPELIGLVETTNTLSDMQHTAMLDLDKVEKE